MTNTISWATARSAEQLVGVQDAVLSVQEQHHKDVMVTIAETMRR